MFALSIVPVGSVESQANLFFSFQYLLLLTHSLILIGERAGLCAFVSRNHSIAMNVESNLAQLIRSKISNPPAFGARIVATVLGDGGLFSQWQRDLMTRSSRIAGMRKRLLDELTALGITNSHSFQHTISPRTKFLPGTPGEWEK